VYSATAKKLLLRSRVIAWVRLLPVLLVVSCGQGPPEGVYVQDGRKDRKITLRPDGRFSVQEGEGAVTGRYRVEGQTLVLLTDDGQSSRGRIQRGNLFDPHGNRWRKQ
jgi:hypothetical protein